MWKLLPHTDGSMPSASWILSTAQSVAPGCVKHKVERRYVPGVPAEEIPPYLLRLWPVMRSKSKGVGSGGNVSVYFGKSEVHLQGLPQARLILGDWVKTWALPM